MPIRDVLSRRLTFAQTVVPLCVSAVVIYLSLSGSWQLALGVLVAGGLAWWAFSVFQRRRFPARVERLQETAVLPWTCGAVWDLIEPAENAHLVDPTIVRGFRVPGTPDGLGEQQAFERADGLTVMIEIIEYRPRRRAVTRQVSPPPAELWRTVQEVEPVDGGGCAYTIALEIDLRAGQRVLPTPTLAWRAGVREQFPRVQQILASAGPTQAAATDASSDRAHNWPPPDG